LLLKGRKSAISVMLLKANNCHQKSVIVTNNVTKSHVTKVLH